MANKKEKIIIDTDAGVDDAQAILIALSKEFSDRVEVIAITCCSGNVGVDQVLINVHKVLIAAERLDIPVYGGACKPLLPVELDASHYHGKDGLGDCKDIPHPEEGMQQKEHAVNYLARISKEFPGEITLLTIGPLTNIALACRMDPNLGKNFKKLVIMGGNYQGKGNVTISSEFNFHFDPEAALIVLDEVSCPVTIVAWELCIKYTMDHIFLEDCLNQGTIRSNFVKRITVKSRQFHQDQLHGMPEEYVPCDEFAAAVLVHPVLILKQKEVFASVEVSGHFTRGQMVIDWRGLLGKRKNVFIVTELDVEKYKSIYKKALQ